MKTETEIIAHYKKRHDDLSMCYYSQRDLAKGEFHKIYDMAPLTKEEFDLVHGQNWLEMDAELIREGYRPVKDLDLPH